MLLNTRGMQIETPCAGSEFLAKFACWVAENVRDMFCLSVLKVRNSFGLIGFFGGNNGELLKTKNFNFHKIFS